MPHGSCSDDKNACAGAPPARSTATFTAMERGHQNACGTSTIQRTADKGHCCSSEHASESILESAKDTATPDIACCPPGSKHCCTSECAIVHAENECMLRGATTPTEGSRDPHSRFQEAVQKYNSIIQRALCLCRDISGGHLLRCCERGRPQTPVRRLRERVSRKCLQQTTECSISGVGTDDSCSRGLQDGCKGKSARAVKTAEPITDVEADPQADEITVNVQGMTCTGCEGKLLRALQSIAGVSKVNVVFVSGTATFRVCKAVADSEQVIAHAGKITGFKLIRVHQDLQILDIQTSDEAQMLMIANPPTGVVSIAKSRPGAMRVSFDPHKIGARSVLEAAGHDACLAVEADHGPSSKERQHLAGMAIATSLAFAFTIPVCVLTWAETPVPAAHRDVASLVLATAVQCIAIREFYWKAIMSLVRSFSVEVDMLVVISITAAYVYSVVAFGFEMADRPLQTGSFFETSTLLISLVMLGRVITGYARVQALGATSMLSLQERRVVRLDARGHDVAMDSRLLEFGDMFRVGAHQRVPTDAIVLQGTSNVDESMLSGEGAPVPKSPDSKIIAGTMNGHGQLTARVVKLPGLNTLADIAQLVQAAQASKPRVQDLSDVVASYFVPVILAVATAVFAVWIAISLRVREQQSGIAVINGVTYTIAVLAVSCPCAIGLAVPMVLMIGGGVAARRGVIIKSASAIERAWSITDVVFDKTGTLTTGTLRVSTVDVLLEDTYYVSGVALAMAKASDHPVSRGVADYLATTQSPQLTTHCSKHIPGQGIEAHLDAAFVRAGNPAWLGVDAHDAVVRFAESDVSLFCITIDGILVAVYALTAELKPEAAAVVRDLRSRGLSLHIVSGDAQKPVESAAKSLLIDNVRFRQSPADKDDHVKRLLENPKRRVLFCGDGVNDAAAIARANVGVSFGSASDVTNSSADVILLGNLDGIIKLLRISRAAYVRILFNFAWSGVYNCFAVLVASGAFVKWRLPPSFAGLGELVSVAPVIGVAATMLWAGRSTLKP